MVVDATGAPASGFSIDLARRAGETTSTMSATRRGSSSTFLISDLVPGTYVVSAETGGQGASGAARVEITAADIDGLVLTLKPPVEVRGTVKFEDSPPAAGWQRERIVSVLYRANASEALVCPRPELPKT